MWSLSTVSDVVMSRDSALLHLFGAESYRVDEVVGGAIRHDAIPLSEEPLYQAVVLICLVFYFVWIYRYFNKHGFSAFVGAASAFTRSREQGVHTGSSSRRLGDTIMLWGLIVGVYLLFVTKVLEVADGVALSHISEFVANSTITEHIARVGMGFWMGLVAVGFVWAMMWSMVVLFVADRVSRSGTVFRDIFALRSQMLLYSVIYLMPVILFCAFGAYDSIRFYFALILVVIFTLFYLIRSFLLFRSKKISILLWILYLCAVEIFPVTLAWGIFTRS